MTTDGTAESGTTLRDYLRVAGRRKWMILQALVLVPVSAIAFSLTQATRYEATAEVLLSRQNLAAALTGTPDATQNLQADRNAQTQASLARVPDVARRVIAGTNVQMTAEEFLAASSVSAKQNADLLDFRVTNEDPALAERLATAYAREFSDFRGELDTKALARARSDLEKTIDKLVAAGDRSSPLYRSLVESRQQLRTLEALQTSNAFPVRNAEEAVQVQPKPVRNAILGLALGLVLGIGLAFLWEALDTNIRSPDEVAARLGTPFLGRVPKPLKQLQRDSGLVMLAQPTSTRAEPFRMLRTNLEFVRLDRDLRTIMITSAVEQEGKSTTIANLAVAFARSGQKVILVDLDLRRPYLARFFNAEGAPGLTQVALGEASLDEALVPIAISSGQARGSSFDEREFEGWNGDGPGERGSLQVLTSGPIPPDPGEFVATRRLDAMLQELRQRADVVLVDSPPMLRAGDAMTLSAHVDAIVVVARINIVRRHMLQELQRLLNTAPAAKLGFVLTGSDDEEGYGVGYGYGYEAAEERGRPTERV